MPFPFPLVYDFFSYFSLFFLPLAALGLHALPSPLPARKTAPAPLVLLLPLARRALPLPFQPPLRWALAPRPPVRLPTLLHPLPWVLAIPLPDRPSWSILRPAKPIPCPLLGLPLPATVSGVPPVSLAPLPPVSEPGRPLKCAGPVPPNILAEPGPVPGVDFVPTCSVEVVIPPPGKGATRGLRAGHTVQRVRGWALRERVIQLHCFEGKSLRQCARMLGRHYKTVSTVWAAVCRDVAGGRATPEEHRDRVRGYLDRHYRRVMEQAQALVPEAAAYGAVVVAAGKALAELHGIKPEEALPSGFSLEDVGREVRVVSPLLIDRIDQVRELRGAAGDPEASRAAANARWAREIPVEGSPAGFGGVDPA